MQTSPASVARAPSPAALDLPSNAPNQETPALALDCRSVHFMPQHWPYQSPRLFVSGHGFSRANNSLPEGGLQPRGFGFLDVNSSEQSVYVTSPNSQ